MNSKEKKLEQLYKEHTEKMRKADKEFSSVSKKLREIDEREKETLNFKQSIIKFLDNVMEMQSEEGYGPEIQKLESTREELLTEFKKAEIELENEYEKLQVHKEKLSEKQQEYQNEYNKRITQLKEE